MTALQRAHDDILSELIALRQEYVDLLVELDDEDVEPAPEPPVAPQSVGALRLWWKIPERHRPASGPLFLAACWERTSRERWNAGDYNGAHDAMEQAAALSLEHEDAIRKAVAA